MRAAHCSVWLMVMALGCGGGADPVDGGADGGADGGLRDASVDAASARDAAADASSTDAAASDASAPDGGAPSCLDEHAAGDRFPVGDGCNFCDCLADGSLACTTRTCPVTRSGCSYDGVEHAYAERFPSTDGCNECVCAASGLACTRRECAGALEEGAILVDSLDEPCGDDPTFTAAAVLSGLPRRELTVPFLYERDRALYPETRADTTVTMRIVYDGGFAVCRIPMPGQEAFDIEILLEWVTADGAFDEGLHTYLRRNASGFVDAWTTAASLEVGELNGTYSPACFDPAGFSFAAQLDADGSGGGAVSKSCERDIGLTVGSWSLEP